MRESNRPSKATVAEGRFKKRYGARKAAMLLERMPREQILRRLLRLQQAGKV